MHVARATLLFQEVSVTLTFLAILLIPFILLVTLLGFVTLNRYIAYKERIALAQMGFSLQDLNREAAVARHGNRGVLWGGVITAMSGLALLLGLATIGVGAWLLGGLVPLFVGVGMVLIYFMTLGSTPNETRQPIPDPLVGHASAAQIAFEEASLALDEMSEETPFATDQAGSRSQGTRVLRSEPERPNEPL
jgi:hypothetical protein